MRNLKAITFLFIIISTMQIKAQTEDLQATAIQAKHLYTELCAKEKNPLYVVNGIVLNNSLNLLADIKPEDIENIDVLKVAEAKEKYGDKGNDGAIVITLRKSGKNKYEKLLKNTKSNAEDINKYDLIISGTISDTENKHISNVIISNLTKKEAYYSDSLGSYKINVGKNDLINFSKKGFKSLTVKATHQTIPNVVLKKRSPNDLIIEKPIIYLYPTEKTDITFFLDFKGKLLTTFPKYESNWEVTAYPDGRIFDKKTKRFYNSLFWDGNQKFPDDHYQYKSGFVVSKNNLTDFLIEKLEIMGLNNLETNEFVQYWLPVLEKNETNFIHFYVNSDYDVISKNIIFPKPDTSIRIFMEFYGLDETIKIPEQKLVKQERKGFTLVEWGGSDVTAPVNELKSLKL